MSPTLRIACRELLHRPLGVVVGAIVVALAVGSTLGAASLLRAYDLRTEAILAERRTEVAARTAALQDEVRQITKRMGFNVLIVPRGQDMADLFAEQYGKLTMPESYADTLAASSIITINHILPSLEQRVHWTERGGRSVLLAGIKGQVPMLRREHQAPIMQPVRAGTAVVGFELARTEGITIGSTIQLLGHRLQVASIPAARGDKRDVTIWVPLDTAQHMLNLHGRINVIWALECDCAQGNLPLVRSEIQRVLPETEVTELGGIALARAEARAAVAREATQALESEKLSREALRVRRERLAALLVSGLVLAAGLSVALLALANVRRRELEIGVLRALGWRSRRVIGLVLWRALATGAAGAVLGCAAALLVAAVLKGTVAAAALRQLAPPATAALALVLTPLLAAAASILPALQAAGRDPADILRED